MPLHHRSAWLGESDPFGTLVAGCRAMGMHVVARTDPHAVREDVRAAHPDWIAHDADGEPRRHWANPELWVTCALGPYNFDFMDQVHREIVQRSTKSTASSRIAGRSREAIATAPTARRTSRTRPGWTCRAVTDRRDPARRAFVAWRKTRLTELWKKWDATVRAANPEASFIPNGPPDLKTAGELAAIQFTDNQARRGVTPPWANGRRAKEYRSVMGRRPIGGIFSVGLEEAYRWKDSVQSEPEITAVGGRGHGKRHAPVGHEVFRRVVRPPLAAGRRAHLRLALRARALSAQRVAARPSGAVCTRSRPRPSIPGVAQGDRHEDHMLGMYHSLVESRVPFELVHEAFLTPDRLDRFKLLILADAAALSDAQCRAIREYVERGGSLLATFASSLYDETGRRRDDFGLADLFGVSFAGRVEGPMQNSYLSLDADPVDGRAASRARGPRRHAPHHQRRVSPRREADDGFSLAAHADSDLSRSADGRRVSAGRAHDDARAVSPRSRAQPGRVHPVGHRPDALGRDVRRPPAAAAKRDRMGHERAAPAVVEGPGVIDVTVWRQRDSMTVHLVNLTNPMMMKGPLREVIPIGPQRVSVRLPAGARPKKVQLLTAGKTIDYKLMGGTVCRGDRAVSRCARSRGY